MNERRAKIIEVVRGLQNNKQLSKKRILLLVSTIKKLLKRDAEKEERIKTMVDAFRTSGKATEKVAEATADVSENVQHLTGELKKTTEKIRLDTEFGNAERKKESKLIVTAIEKSGDKTVNKIEKSSEDDRVFLLSLVKSAIQAIGALFSKLTIRVQPTKEHYQIPQKVIIYDPKSGKSMSAGDFSGSRSGAQAFSTVVVDTASMVSAIEAQMAQYRVSDVDDASTVKYYGFLRANGYWYILQEDTSVAPKTYRYVAGLTDFATNWTNRASLTYGYFNDIF